MYTKERHCCEYCLRFCDKQLEPPADLGTVTIEETAEFPFVTIVTIMYYDDPLLISQN